MPFSVFIASGNRRTLLEMFLAFVLEPSSVQIYVTSLVFVGNFVRFSIIDNWEVVALCCVLKYKVEKRYSKTKKKSYYRNYKKQQQKKLFFFSGLNQWFSNFLKALHSKPLNKKSMHTILFRKILIQRLLLLGYNCLNWYKIC